MPDYRENMSAVLREIERLGGMIDRIEHGRHWKIYWSFGGRKLVQIVAVSPRTGRSRIKARGDIRRAVRATAL
jgi:hypothetical protein